MSRAFFVSSQFNSKIEMHKPSNKYQQFQDALKMIQGRLHVIDMTIPINVQAEFFDAIQKKGFEFYSSKMAQASYPHLFEKDYPLASKKKILCRLSNLSEVKVFRMLEKYARETTGDLKYWAALACEQCRMNMENELLGENQVFLSTGLGGRDEMLRFFIVFYSKDFEFSFTEFQKKLVRKEVKFFLHKHGCVFESMAPSDNFITWKALFPYKFNLGDLLRDIISEINQYGAFLSDVPLITNVKEFNAKEILDFRRQQELLNM